MATPPPKRRAFFSFHYQRDIWRVNQVRNAGIVDAQAAAGWADASLWEEAKKKSDAAIKKLIDDGLVGSSVTVVLIGAKTSERQYVKYEIEQSVKRGNGLLGVRIHGIKDKDGKTDTWGAAPQALLDAGATIKDYDRDKFGEWVQAAYKAAHGDK